MPIISKGKSAQEPNRRWIWYAGLGGLALVTVSAWAGWEYWDYRREHTAERQYAAQRDTSQHPKDRQLNCKLVGRTELRCLLQSPETGGADEHTKADLKAQQDVAEWSFMTMLVSVLGVVLSAAAVAFTGWAAWAAASASNAARDSVEDARKHARIEAERHAEAMAEAKLSTQAALDAAQYARDTLHSDRAWIQYISFSAFYVETDAFNNGEPVKVLGLEVFASNFGRSPAINMRLFVSSGYMEIEGLESIKYDDAWGPRQGAANIGPGQKFPTQRVFIQPDKADGFRESKLTPFMFAAIDYNDIYTQQARRTKILLTFEWAGEVTENDLVKPSVLCSQVECWNTLT